MIAEYQLMHREREALCVAPLLGGELAIFPGLGIENEDSRHVRRIVLHLHIEGRPLGVPPTVRMCCVGLHEQRRDLTVGVGSSPRRRSACTAYPTDLPCEFVCR